MKLITVNSGDICPQTGLWFIDHDGGTVERFIEGQIIPDFDGRSSVFQFIEDLDAGYRL